MNLHQGMLDDKSCNVLNEVGSSVLIGSNSTQGSFSEEGAILRQRGASLDDLESLPSGAATIQSASSEIYQIGWDCEIGCCVASKNCKHN